MPCTTATIHTLASCEWIKKSQPLCLIGDSGTGKSHMLIALGTEAAMKGYRVRYTLATPYSTHPCPHHRLTGAGEGDNPALPSITHEHLGTT